VNSDAIIDRLARAPAAIRSAAAMCSIDDAAWKPDGASWSVLEIICHLADEEDEDFPLRLRLLLEDPGQDWPPIDPEGWCEQRSYRDRLLHEQLVRFESARAGHIAWLRPLLGVDWSLAKAHPAFGPMHAGDLLGAWAAHDALHLRQIAKRLHQLSERDAAGFTTRYAGDW